MCSEIGYPKSKQTAKNKPKNEKRMSQKEYHAYCDHIRDVSDGICQACGDFPFDDTHHTKWGSFGADKDDRSLVGVCRGCHDKCHADRDFNDSLSWIATDNYQTFKGE